MHLGRTTYMYKKNFIYSSGSDVIYCLILKVEGICNKVNGQCDYRTNKIQSEKENVCDSFL